MSVIHILYLLIALRFFYGVEKTLSHRIRTSRGESSLTNEEAVAAIKALEATPRIFREDRWWE